MQWIIKLPLPGDDGRWFELCRCENAENVAAIVKALITFSAIPPRTFLIERVDP